ncbi:hypothetical protein [Sciscionella sediminilitoris]|uniref:hypothetical protein n=1 Tax=Sciscionella sediminilitoris TaxID=1445613 RepID=UPI0004DFBFE8|nr:hypothetical protein [Sciscionella sp. SE31]
MPGYLGSGPYCYTHSLAMLLGADAPPAAVLETLTGAPFGFTLLGGEFPLFDPYGWDPEFGLDTAIAALGWRCARTTGGTPEEALSRLRADCASGPVLAGPVDMGLLSYQPHPPTADHYLVVLEVGAETVLVHDPHGHPYAHLPVESFVDSWRAETVDYTEVPFVSRAHFVREREIGATEALRAAIPEAIRWLDGRTDRPMPPGTLSGPEALEALAAAVRGGLDPEIRGFLGEFSIRLGARRLVDAARCLAMIDRHGASATADEQARIAGSLQYPLSTGDDAALAAGLLRLAPGYARLRAELARH